MRRELDVATIQRVIIYLLLLVLQVLSPTWSLIHRRFQENIKKTILNVPVHLITNNRSFYVFGGPIVPQHLARHPR